MRHFPTLSAWILALQLAGCGPSGPAASPATVEAYSAYLLADLPDPSLFTFRSRKIMTDDDGLTILCGQVMEQMPANLGEVRRRFLVMGEGDAPRVVWRELGPSFPVPAEAAGEWDACDRKGRAVR